MALHQPDVQAGALQDAMHPQNDAGAKKCHVCGLAKPSSRPLKHLQEHWHGQVCPYCYGSRRYKEGNHKEISLTRRAHFETWVAAKLLRKRCKKPKGKALGIQPDQLRTHPFAMMAFAGQLRRTLASLCAAELADLAEPLREHMKELGL